jgi:Protein of unknown function (DUF3433)
MTLGSSDLKTVKGITCRKASPGQADIHIVAQPQITKAHSHRSTSASEEILSDYASNASSQTQLTGTKYETPPSRMSTPAVHQQPLDSEMTLPSKPSAAQPAPLNIRSTYVENGRRRELNGRIFLNTSPPTPDPDDIQYIRFAIDQLTRDEELLGQGRQGSVTSDDYPTQRIITDQGLGYFSPPAPSQQLRQPVKQPSQPGNFTKRPVRGDILLPIAPPTGTQWPNLGFIPMVLRLPFLMLLICICLLVIAGIIFSNVYALRNHGLFDYDGTSTPRYFVFEFLPQLLGILIILWLLVLQAAIYRILPFLSMSSDRPYDRVLQDMPILATNFVLPDFSCFRKGEPLVGVVLAIFWLANFTVPLLSCLYQTQFITNDGPSRWRWTSVQGVGWVLLILYILLIAALVCCIVRFRKRNSALTWDPVSLADLIQLFQKSNFLADFECSEISGSLRTLIPAKHLRLGYWTTSKVPEIFHTVGEEKGPILKSSFPNPERTGKGPEARVLDSFNVEGQRSSYASSFTRNIHSPFVRYRWAPWFLRDSAVLAWIVIAIILLTAFLVVSFVNKAVQDGFPPRLPSITRSGGFSSSNFLYSFLPSLLGMFLFLAWQPIDTYFRAIQPFANLSDPAGAAAENSLLLDYPSLLPIAVTLRALINRDLKVAWTSFIGLMSITIPVLAGGIFTAQNFPTDNQVRIVAAMPAYLALCVFVAVYALSYLTIWPTRKRYLPHSVRSLADLLSFIYQSPLLSDVAFVNVKTKADLVGRLVIPPKGVEMDGNPMVSARYAFGIFVGRDGREHLGIDRLQRPGNDEMLVTTGMVR